MEFVIRRGKIHRKIQQSGVCLQVVKQWRNIISEWKTRERARLWWQLRREKVQLPAQVRAKDTSLAQNTNSLYRPSHDTPISTGNISFSHQNCSLTSGASLISPVTPLAVSVSSEWAWVGKLMHQLAMGWDEYECSFFPLNEPEWLGTSSRWTDRKLGDW